MSPRHIRTPFMDPLVRAIAAGDKLVTRRLIKREHPPEAGHSWAGCLCRQIDPTDTPCLVCEARFDVKARPGDIMDVCEALVPADATESTPFEWTSYRPDGMPALHISDVQRIDLGGGQFLPVASYEPAPWRWKVNVLPARYCPAWAVRYHRTLISVRPERLSDVTDAEAVLEGIRYLGWPETREGFIEGFCKMHKLDSDRVWVERREWARGEGS